MKYTDFVDIMTGRSTMDRYGETVIDWTDPTLERTDANVSPLGTSEQLSTDREKIVSRYRLHTPPWAEITKANRVRWRGEDYEIDGRPEPITSGGRVDHVETLLSRVEG